MDKRILKKIAQEWSKAVLLANSSDSFEEDCGLTQEECDYVLAESHKIAEKITKEPYTTNLNGIIARYYEFE